MKRNLVRLACALLLFAATGPAQADDWDEFSKLVERYYTLDGGPLARVACEIRTPIMAQQLEAARLQMPPQLLDMRDNLSEFAFVFDAEKGPTFTRPQLSVKVLSTEGIEDPEAFRLGARGMESNFDAFIYGAEQTLTALLSGYVRPKREDFSEVSVSHEDDLVRARYLRNGAQVEAVIQGASRNVVSTRGEVRLDTLEHYDAGKADGRDLLRSVSVVVASGGQKVKSLVDVEYQQLEGLPFPAIVRSRSITSAADAAEGDPSTEVEFRLELVACRTLK